jgi:hypothetical protein
MTKNSRTSKEGKYLSFVNQEKTVNGWIFPPEHGQIPLNAPYNNRADNRIIRMEKPFLPTKKCV